MSADLDTRIPASHGSSQQRHTRTAGPLAQRALRLPTRARRHRPTFKDHGQAVARQMDVMADEYAGTQTGAYARLADHLVCRDMVGALTTVANVASWNGQINTDTADDEFIEPELRALGLLSQVMASAPALFL
jgi:hypothetical protein